MSDAATGRPRWLMPALVGALALLVAVAAVVLLTRNGEGDGAQPAPTSTTTGEPGPTSTAPVTTGPGGTAAPTTAPATTAPPAGDLSSAVWPVASGPTRFSAPVDAARSFAVDFVGFTDPVVGTFRAGDSRSGEVDVRPRATGPVTTVLLRQLGNDGSWWVIGSATPNIRVQDPSALDTIASPARLRGTSTAFEATVNVEVREDGNRQPLGSGFVMGGSMGDLGPFDGTVTFTSPRAAAGAVVLLTRSAEDGRVWEASVVRVRFGSCGPAPSRPTAGAGQMVVTVYFSCGDSAGTVAAYRVVPQSAGVLRASLEQLLAGPTATERAAGLSSFFSSATAGMVTGVNVRPDGSAVVDFADLRPVIPNASTSAGSRVLLEQLDATVFQFASVRNVTYRIAGNCQAFTEWLQFGGCDPRTR
jgi:hypothetical protein